MAHTKKIYDLMNRLKLLQSALTELENELEKMIPAERMKRERTESLKIRTELKSKLLKA